ncbi:hypothetical protein QQ045_000459 [Rhodiola kirilowii]
MITNLMFADDSILFVRAEVDDIMRLKSTLVKYEELSGKQVNLIKSEVCVGNNVGSDKTRLIRSILGVKSVTKIERYLGFLSVLVGGKLNCSALLRAESGRR